MVLTIARYDDIVHNKIISNKSITTVDLQNKCIHINDTMLNTFPNLTNIVNARNIKIIDSHAFDLCSKLVSIQLDDTIEYIGENAFDETAISTIKIPRKLKYISNETFINCKSLQHVIFSNDAQLVEIKNGAFGNCTSLEVIKFPAKLKLIDENSFADCINLQKVFIPKTAECIKHGAFYNCKKLKQIIFY